MYFPVFIVKWYSFKYFWHFFSLLQIRSIIRKTWNVRLHAFSFSHLLTRSKRWIFNCTLRLPKKIYDGTFTINFLGNMRACNFRYWRVPLRMLNLDYSPESNVAKAAYWASVLCVPWNTAHLTRITACKPLQSTTCCKMRRFTWRYYYIWIIQIQHSIWLIYFYSNFCCFLPNIWAGQSTCLWIAFCGLSLCRQF